ARDRADFLDTGRGPRHYPTVAPLYRSDRSLDDVHPRAHLGGVLPSAAHHGSDRPGSRLHDRVLGSPRVLAGRWNLARVGEHHPSRRRGRGPLRGDPGLSPLSLPAEALEHHWSNRRPAFLPISLSLNRVDRADRPETCPPLVVTVDGSG